MITFQKERLENHVKLTAFEFGKKIATKYVFIPVKSKEDRIEHSLRDFFQALQVERGEISNIRLTELVKEW